MIKTYRYKLKSKDQQEVYLPKVATWSTGSQRAMGFRLSLLLADAGGGQIMSLVTYAKSELARIGAGEDGLQEMMNNHIIHMVEEFSKEGHSGFSANYAIAVLRRLLQFKPLSALTGEDDEWTEVADGVFQNKRCSAVFKDDTRYGGKPYYIEGKVFSSDGGETWFTNRDSCVVIEFPFTVPDKPEKIVLGEGEHR